MGVRLPTYLTFVMFHCYGVERAGSLVTRASLVGASAEEFWAQAECKRVCNLYKGRQQRTAFLMDL